MKNLILISLIILLSCKANKNTVFDESKASFSLKYGIPFEDTAFKNSNSELHAINNILNSFKENKNVLVIFEGKEISFKQFEKNAKKLILPIQSI